MIKAKKAKWIRRTFIELKCVTKYSYPIERSWVSQRKKLVKIECEEAHRFTLPREEFCGLPYLFDWLYRGFSFIIWPYYPKSFLGKEELWLQGDPAYRSWTNLWPFWVSLRGIWKE